MPDVTVCYGMLFDFIAFGFTLLLYYEVGEKYISYPSKTTFGCNF